jgi:HSP20 family protein
MERLFQEVGFGGSQGFAEIASWAPQVETLTRDGQLIIRADLPGIDKDNVEVEIRDNSVILRGERREEHHEEREGFYRSERSYGSFYREIPLPVGVDTSTAKANFNDGVLEITMAAPESESRGRRLQIQDSQTGEQPKQKTRAASSRS